MVEIPWIATTMDRRATTSSTCQIRRILCIQVACLRLHEKEKEANPASRSVLCFQPIDRALQAATTSWGVYTTCKLMPPQIKICRSSWRPVLIEAFLVWRNAQVKLSRPVYPRAILVSALAWSRPMSLPAVVALLFDKIILCTI